MGQERAVGRIRTSAGGAVERLSEPETAREDVLLIPALPARVPLGLVSF